VIKNLRTGEVISKNLNISPKALDKFFGMLLSRNSSGIVLRTRFGVHTFFMRESIDVIIIDSNCKAVRLKKGLSPWEIYLWEPKFEIAIELPVGSIERSKTKIGDKIKFIK
jgi:uncharacterized membrane protein (UPF0127 family)